jgi:DNA-binding winged helix-turn-helix (wHTH) protein
MTSQLIGLQQSIRFGEDFELDLRPRRLRRGSHVLKLERIPLEILILLLEHRGEIVSREKIVARVWGNVCLAAELQETGRALRTICREFSRDALPWLLHYSAEAFVRWLLV